MWCEVIFICSFFCSFLLNSTQPKMHMQTYANKLALSSHKQMFKTNDERHFNAIFSSRCIVLLHALPVVSLMTFLWSFKRIGWFMQFRFYFQSEPTNFRKIMHIHTLTLYSPIDGTWKIYIQTITRLSWNRVSFAVYLFIVNESTVIKVQYFFFVIFHY